MAPGIHPPCTPSASCQPVRCHPTPPPCYRPTECLRRTASLGLRPCQSAVSILATESRTKCASCGKFRYTRKRSGRDPRNLCAVRKYLKTKSRIARLKRKDKIFGGHRYLRYVRRRGKPRALDRECCAGQGHRGRLKKKGCRCCNYCSRCNECCTECCERCCEQCCPCCYGETGGCCCTIL